MAWRVFSSAITFGIRNPAVHPCHHSRARAPTDLWCDVFGLDDDGRVVSGVGVRLEIPPGFHSLLPGVAGGRQRTALEIGNRLLVRSHHARPSPAFNRHVAERHAPFHAECADNGAGVFDDVAGPAGRADFTDDGQDHIFRRAAVRKDAVDPDFHGLGPLLHQALGCQHVLDFAGADPECQGAKGAVRRRMRVAADDRRAGEGEALFRADHMHDALPDIAHVE